LPYELQDFLLSHEANKVVARYRATYLAFDQQEKMVDYDEISL